MTESAVTNAGGVIRPDTESRLKAELFEIAGGIWNHLLRQAEERLRLQMALEHKVLAKDRETLAKLVAANVRAGERQVQSPSASSLVRQIGRASKKIVLAERELADATSELSTRRRVVEQLQSELSEYEARLARALRQDSSAK
jgi:hypothetical protein